MPTVRNDLWYQKQDYAAARPEPLGDLTLWRQGRDRIVDSKLFLTWSIVAIWIAPIATVE